MERNERVLKDLTTVVIKLRTGLKGEMFIADFGFQKENIFLTGGCSKLNKKIIYNLTEKYTHVYHKSCAVCYTTQYQFRLARVCSSAEGTLLHNRKMCAFLQNEKKKV